MAYATVTLTGTYQTPDGTPHKGHVEIIPSERVIKDTTGNVILTGRVKVDLDAQGAFTVALPATDDPTLNPTGFGYTIAAKLHSSHPPAVSFSLPAALGATTVEDLTPVDPSTFTPTPTYADASTVTALDSRVTTVESDIAGKADAADVPTTPADLGAEPAGLSTTTNTALAATYIAPATIAPTATGIAATDTANLQGAIDATPSGGQLWIPAGTYVINTALVLSQNITIVGEGVDEIMGAVAADTTALNTPPTAPYLEGTVVMQTTPGAHGFTLGAGGITANIRNLGVRFDPAIAFQNTGDGFYMVGPTITTGGGTGSDSGLVWSQWDNVVVFGHDGDHYAFRLTNPMNNTFAHLRSYGGGGLGIHGDSYRGNYGNSTFNHPYCALFAGGTAHAISITCRQNGGTGRLNFMSFIRPQGIGLSMGPTRFGTDPINPAAQKLFYCDDNTPNWSVIAGDFEHASTLTGMGIRLPTSLPFFFDPASTYPAPATPFPLLRGYDGNRALWSDMSLGRYTSQPLSNKFTKAGLGSGAPAVTEVRASDDWRGQIGFGTGTGPAAGEMVDIRFNKNRGFDLFPTITPMNAATAALGLYVSTMTSVGFVVSASNPPAASQPGGTYQFAYTMSR